MLIHRVLLSLAPSVAKPIARCVGFGLITSAVQVAQSVSLAMTLSEVSRRGGGKPEPWLIAFAASFVARASLAWFRERLVVNEGTQITASLRDRLVERLLAAGPLQLTQDRTGRVQSTLVDGTEGLDVYYSRYVPQIVLAVLVPISIVIALSRISVAVAVLLAISVVAVLVIPRVWDAVLLKRGKEHWASYQTLASDYLDALQGIATLRVAGAAGIIRDELEARADDLYRKTVAQLRLSLVETAISSLIISAGTAGAVVVAAARFSGNIQSGGGGLSNTELILVLLLAAETFRPVRELAQHWHAGYLGFSAADGVREILELPPAVVEGAVVRSNDPAFESVESSHVGSVIARPAPELRFEAVSVRYSSRTQPALDRINLVIPSGSTVAVVGASGAGKSTLVGLLLRWLDPEQGTVRIDGCAVSDMSFDLLRSTVAAVFQDTYLFAGTVDRNLRLGAQSASRDEVYAAAKVAGIHEEILALANGYETVIGERGLTLSGGQRQRLAIARALLRNAPVLVLDEPTSSVDVATESSIVDALEALRRGRTTLLVAHRLSTVRCADSIVVLDGGRIVEQGTFAELSQAGGNFAALLAAQDDVREDRSLDGALR